MPPAGWWGDALERLGWLDGFIAQDMKLCLNRLEKVFHAPKEEMAA